VSLYLNNYLFYSIGGLILDFTVSNFKGIAVFQPVINGVGGNLVAVQASRISTSLHRDSCLGKLPHYASSVCLNPFSVFCTQGKMESPELDLMHWSSYHNICGTVVNTSKFLWNLSKVICVHYGCRNTIIIIIESIIPSRNIGCL